MLYYKEIIFINNSTYILIFTGIIFFLSDVKKSKGVEDLREQLHPAKTSHQ